MIPTTRQPLRSVLAQGARRTYVRTALPLNFRVTNVFLSSLERPTRDVCKDFLILFTELSQRSASMTLVFAAIPLHEGFRESERCVVLRWCGYGGDPDLN